MKKLTKKAKSEIKVLIENNQPQIEWDQNTIDREGVADIIEKGLDEYLSDLWESNIDYIFELEDYLTGEVKNQWEGYDEEEIEEFCREHICVDMNVKNLMSQIPDITCLAYIYSNYDCCNSFDKFEPDGYLWDAYQRTKKGVKKSDFMHEFYNGAYGGSLFCFAFQTDIETFLELKEKEKTGKTITIPRGTQYGFFSSFQRAGSVFKKVTYRDMELPLHGETEYDNVALEADVSQHYSLRDVYGSDDFIEGGNIGIN